MNPLPKWAGVISALGALLAQALPIFPPNVAGWVSAGLAVVALFCHSVTGTGGKTQ